MRDGQPTEEELVEEHYDLLKKIGDADLQVSGRCERLIERYERGELDG